MNIWIMDINVVFRTTFSTYKKEITKLEETQKL